MRGSSTRRFTGCTMFHYDLFAVGCAVDGAIFSAMTHHQTEQMRHGGGFEQRMQSIDNDHTP